MTNGLKQAAKGIVLFILATISVVFGMMIISAWQNSKQISALFEQSSPEFHLGFIAAMIFAGLYFLNVMVGFIIAGLAVSKGE